MTEDTTCMNMKHQKTLNSSPTHSYIAIKNIKLMEVLLNQLISEICVNSKIKIFS